MALEEDALRGARVDLLGLDKLDRAVLQVVEDDQLANAVVLQTGLND